MAETATKDAPKFEKVQAMPKVSRGRRREDLTAYKDELEATLKENAARAIAGVEDRNIRERFARKIRAAAAELGLEAETTYDEGENRLYFRAWKQGEAPPRGRRKISTRTNGAAQKATGKTKK